MLDAFFASRRHPTGKPLPEATMAPPTTSPCSSESLIALYDSPPSKHTVNRVSMYSPGEARKSLAAYMDSDSYSLMSETDSRHPANRPPGSGFLASVWALGTTITVCCVDTSREVVNDVVTLAAGFARERRNYAASVASSAGMDDFLEDPNKKKDAEHDDRHDPDFPEFEVVARVPELEDMPDADTRVWAVRYRSKSREDLRALAKTPTPPVLRKAGSVSSLRESEMEKRKEDIRKMLEEAQSIVDALKAAPGPVILPIEAVSAAPATELKRQPSVSSKHSVISVDDDEEEAIPEPEAEEPKIEVDSTSDRMSTEHTTRKSVEHMPDVIEVDNEEEETAPPSDNPPTSDAPAAASSAIADEPEKKDDEPEKKDDEPEKKDDESEKKDDKKDTKPAARMANAFRRRMSVSNAFSPFKKPKDTTSPTTPALELTPPPTPPANIETSSITTTQPPPTPTPKSRIPTFSRSRRGSISAESALQDSSYPQAQDSSPSTPANPRRLSFVSVASSLMHDQSASETPAKKPILRRPTFSKSKTDGATDRRKSWFLPKHDDMKSTTSVDSPRPPSISDKKPTFFRKPTFGASSNKLDDSRPATAGAESALDASSVVEVDSVEKKEEKPTFLKRAGTMSFGRTTSSPAVPGEKRKEAAAKMKGLVRASTFMGRAKKEKEKKKEEKGKGVAVETEA